MEEKTYNILLTVILVIIALAILIGGGIIVSDLINNKETEKEVKETLGEYKTTQLKPLDENENKDDGKGLTIEEIKELARKGNLGQEQGNSAVNNDGDSAKSIPKIKNVKMEGYNVIGVMKIPKINLEYPILSKVTKRTLEIALAQLNTQRGINNPGNTTILGHNYKSNMFFSKLYLLKKGDKITITDLFDRTVTYEVYDIAERTPNDSTYISRNTEGRREISLSTCNDDSTLRLVIQAVAVDDKDKVESEQPVEPVKPTEETTNTTSETSNEKINSQTN